MYFFYPVVWFVSNRINMARECLCDEMVIAKKQISARDYATGLFQTIKLHAFDQKKLVPMPAFGHQHNKLKQRFHNLKGENRMKKTTTVLSVLGIAIIALTVLPMAEVTVKSGSQTIAAEVAADNVETKVNIGTNKVGKVDEIVVGRLTAKFGQMIDPFTKKERFHNAIDIAAEKGTPVHSFGDGVVVKVVVQHEANKGAGKYITIQHSDGIQTRYTQLSLVLVKEGQTVKAGDEIGKVGSTGRSTGPHLHFELMKEGEHVDPLKYLEK
jgi:murein DD-endopeptidase MepM/ murein hydrolase activator NlpD